MKTLKSVLIIQNGGFGDHVLATALVETIKAHRPDVAIDVLIGKGNESIFEGDPQVRRMFVWDKKQGKYRNLFRLAREVRAQHYDLVLNLHRFLNLGLLTLYSGAGVTVGFDKSPVSRFFTRRVQHASLKDDGTVLHETERNHRLVDWFIPGPPAKPRLYPSKADFDLVAGYKNGPFICIGVAASRFTNTLPEAQWSDLIRRIPQTFTVYLLGAGPDIPRCDRIAHGSGHGHVVNLAGRLSLVQSAALMKDAVMNYTCDSSALHLASAMNAPVASVYLSTTTANGFGPLSDVRTIVETKMPLDCRPCTYKGKPACPQKHFNCAKTITTDQLLEPLRHAMALVLIFAFIA